MLACADMLNAIQWEELRAIAREAVQRDRNRVIPNLRLGTIDGAALRACRAWNGPGRIASWDWHAVMKRPAANRFEAAFWHGRQLCGLAYGPAEGFEGLGFVGIEYLEGDPAPDHPLKKRVTDIAVALAETQARLAGVPAVRLLGPGPALTAFYQSFGYELVARPREAIYLEKRLQVYGDEA